MQKNSGIRGVLSTLGGWYRAAYRKKKKTTIGVSALVGLFALGSVLPDEKKNDSVAAAPAVTTIEAAPVETTAAPAPTTPQAVPAPAPPPPVRKVVKARHRGQATVFRGAGNGLVKTVRFTKPQVISWTAESGSLSFSVGGLSADSNDAVLEPATYRNMNVDADGKWTLTFKNAPIKTRKFSGTEGRKVGVVNLNAPGYACLATTGEFALYDAPDDFDDSFDLIDESGTKLRTGNDATVAVALDSGRHRLYTDGFGDKWKVAVHWPQFDQRKATLNKLCHAHKNPPAPVDVTGDEPVDPGQPDSCDHNYVGACVPNDGVDHDCPEIGQMVIVVGDDPDRLDADHDGFGCESYRH